MWKHKNNQPRIGANPPFGREESDLLFLTFASLLCSLAHPSSGSFGQILSPPQRLPIVISPPPFSLKNSLNISFRRCRGTDRICPNGPDEGTSRSWLKDTTSESEGQQIRFASPEGRIRADSRLVLSHVSTPSTTLPKLDWE